MKTLFLTLFISVLFILNVQAQISYHIHGTVDRADIKTMYFDYGGTGNYIDSVVVKDGKFDMKGSFKSPAVTMMVVRKTPHRSVKVILDNGDYLITVDKDFKTDIVTNALCHNLWRNWYTTTAIAANSKAKDSLVKDYMQQIENGNYNLSQQYLINYKKLEANVLNSYKKLVTDHPDCYIVPYLLKGSEALTWDNFGESFNKLTPEVQQNEWGVQLKALLDKTATLRPDQNVVNMTMLGNKVRFFDSKDVDGKTFNFSSIKGKWMLLDFWASWCAPCRAELPSLLKAYDQFKDKNFVICSVSVDKDVAAWKKALTEDKNPPFIHSNIAEFGNSDGFKFYNVISIPSNFLINPEGRIVSMNLRQEDLAKTLARLIK